MQEIETASWVEMYTNRFVQEKEEGHTIAAQHWLRMTPPAEAWRTEYGDGWSHDVIDERGHLHTASDWKDCALSPHSHPFERDDLLRHVFFPPPDRNPSPENPSAPNRPRPDWQREEVEQDGQSLLRWHCDYVQGNFRVLYTVLTEPETHRIVRKECHETNLLTGKPAAIVISDQYGYNEEPPEGTFDMPPGRPIVQRDDQRITPKVWDSLSEQERTEIQEVIHRSDTGWRNADFAAFSSVWKFHYVNRAPRKAEWRERVQKQEGLWTGWISIVESATTGNLVVFNVAPNAFLGEPTKRQVLQVYAKLSVSWDGDSPRWEGRAQFTLSRTWRGYRIVHWECF